MRRALEDLKRYLEERNLREKHLEDQRLECIDLVQQGGFPTPVVEVDTEWLADRTRLHGAATTAALEPLASYRQGVVYAVQCEGIDPAHIFSKGHDVVVDIPIKAGDLLGKVRLSAEEAENAYGNYKFGGPDGQAVSRGPILGNIQRWDEPVFNGEFPHPGRAGQDHALEIVREFGTPEIVQAIEKDPTRRNEYW